MFKTVHCGNDTSRLVWKSTEVRNWILCCRLRRFVVLCNCDPYSSVWAQGGPKSKPHYQESSLNGLKTVSEAIRFNSFRYNMSRIIL